MSRPNILFITLDQWRGDCLGSAGHPVVETPNLDRLAAEGVRFTSHYAQSAPCGPSRASRLTGKSGRAAGRERGEIGGGGGEGKKKRGREERRTGRKKEESEVKKVVATSDSSYLKQTTQSDDPS